MQQPTRRAFGISVLACAVLVPLLTAVSPVHAERKQGGPGPGPGPGSGSSAGPLVVPPREQQEILIKTSLLTFNDANLTGNYTVLHARLATVFRNQFSAEQLADVFKSFRDQRINLS